jgi:tetratricopeptide (TPR) repeat protein
MKRANLILMAALAAAGLVTATGALFAPAAAVAATAAPKLGAKMSKPIAAAQEAIKVKDWDGALAALAEAQAIEPKTPYEAFVIDYISWYPLVQKKDYAAAEGALARAMASGFVPETEQATRYKALAQLNFQLKQYPKTVEYGRKVLELAPGSDDVAVLVAQAMFLSDDFNGARSFVQQYTASATTPNEQLLQIALQANAELNDRAGAIAVLEQLIRSHPSQRYWHDLLSNQLYETKGDRDLRALYRLMADTNTLEKPEDYSEMATLLLGAGYPGEAKGILDRGLAAGVFKGEALTRAQTDLKRATSGADADRKDLPGADQALAAAKTGNEMVATGKLFFSAGEYGKAADAIRKGLDKGGVTDADDAQMLLGIALVRAGQGPAAVEALGKVRDAKLAGIARLWKLYVETRGQPAAPSAG